MDLNELIAELEKLREHMGHGDADVYYMGLLSPVNSVGVYSPIDRSMAPVVMFGGK